MSPRTCYIAHVSMQHWRDVMYNLHDITYTIFLYNLLRPYVVYHEFFGYITYMFMYDGLYTILQIWLHIRQHMSSFSCYIAEVVYNIKCMLYNTSQLRDVRHLYQKEGNNFIRNKYQKEI